jgi:hypothetical protein
LLHCRAQEDVCVFQAHNGLLRHWSCVSVILHDVLHDAVALSQLHDANALHAVSEVPEVEQRSVQICSPLFHVHTAAAARHVVDRICILQVVRHVAEAGSQIQSPLLSVLHAEAVT